MATVMNVKESPKVLSYNAELQTGPVEMVAGAVHR